MPANGANKLTKLVNSDSPKVDNAVEIAVTVASAKGHSLLSYNYLEENFSY